MRIIGIDPGYAIIGWGVLEYNGSKFQTLDYGAITTPAGQKFQERIYQIHKDLDFLLTKYQPELMSMERLYFTTNQKTAIDVAQARGVLLLTASMHNLPCFELTPLQVKQSVVGYGKATKSQVMEMTKRLLNLKQVPKPDDTADALAIAIAGAHSSHSILGKYSNF